MDMRSALAAGLLLAAPAIASAGIVDTALPVLPGAGEAGKLLYTAAGLNASYSNMAVAVHCTNVGSEAAEVGVEFFGFTGTPANDVSAGNGVMNIQPGYTRTLGTTNSAFLAEDFSVTLGTPIDQGSLRITSPSTKLICHAQQLDSAANPPSSIWTVPLVAKTKQKGD